MEQIKKIISEYYKSDDPDANEEAFKELYALGAEELAEFILNAWNRDWITKSNLGLDEEGNII